ncbi:hypothetical protein TcBrA4_0111640 [Trypanosoma cruzi]|nr:hypothetical protein TcBrA4_0111640 [Trypanosoma cruzi]
MKFPVGTDKRYERCDTAQGGTKPSTEQANQGAEDAAAKTTTSTTKAPTTTTTLRPLQLQRRQRRRTRDVTLVEIDGSLTLRGWSPCCSPHPHWVHHCG